MYNLVADLYNLVADLYNLVTDLYNLIPDLYNLVTDLYNLVVGSHQLVPHGSCSITSYRVCIGFCQGGGHTRVPFSKCYHGDGAYVCV